MNWMQPMRLLSYSFDKILCISSWRFTILSLIAWGRFLETDTVDDPKQISKSVQALKMVTLYSGNAAE